MKKEEFEIRANEIHHGIYDYSRVVDGKQIDKVLIGCSKHGYFEQTMFAHLHGQGCPKCAYEEKGNLRRKTTEEFIEQAIKVHGNKYSYEETVYINNYTKVKIRCPKHGIFLQTPFNHLHGQGCPECARERKNAQKYL